MNNLSLHIQFNIAIEISWLKLHLQKFPEDAKRLAIAHYEDYRELVERYKQLQTENKRLKSISLPPFPTPSHGKLQAEYDDLHSEYLDVLIKNARLRKENQQLRRENKDWKQVIDALTKDDSEDSLSFDDVLLPDFIEEVL